MVSAKLLDIPVHPVGYHKVLEILAGWIETKHRPSAYVTQVNVHSVVTAQSDERCSEALRHADLSVPDGMPLVWLLRLRGSSIKTRVYGPDLMLMICEEAAKKGWKCFLYGGKEGIPELLRDTLVNRFPGLNIVGVYSPPFRDLTEEEDGNVCAMINRTKPHILWVGLGAPKQDIWMYQHRNTLDVSVMHGVGAAFDFITGQVRQAPRWMMNSGLEWLFRLYCEPRRLWKRYTVTNLKFFYYLFAREVVPILNNRRRTRQ